MDKTYGEMGTVMKKWETWREEVEVIPGWFGFGLDIALGVGGYPKVESSKFAGPESL